MPKILIIADEDFNQLMVGRNGTLTLALSFAARGYEVYFAKEVEVGSEINYIFAEKIKFKKEIYNLYELYGDMVRKDAMLIKNRQFSQSENNSQNSKFLLGSQEKFWKLSNTKKILYQEFHLILNRLDPVDDVRRTRDQIDRLRIIGIKHKVKVVGLPENIDKYEPLVLGEFCPDSFFFDASLPLKIDVKTHLQKMLKQHHSLVIKPLKSGQGKGVKLANDVAKIVKAVKEIKEEFGDKLDGGLIAQEMIPGVVRGDVRTVIYRNDQGKFVLGGHVARVQLDKGFINCISTGSNVAANIEAMLSTKEISDLNLVTKKLLTYFNSRKHDFRTPIIGIDFLPRALDIKKLDSKCNSMVIGEINFLCVALFNMLDHLTNKSVFGKQSITHKIIDGIIAS